ncbi:MAG: FtsW/RodA/SpoVE family cell cycle protein [Acidobacteria bacterium]|nr:FtsW/RodA/SpoVE family cell cycle protein [Acidobacteriota bacterium]
MGVTYTRAGDLQRVRNRSTSITLGERLLLLTSAAVVLAILLAYAGRIRAEQFGEPHAPLPINLNTQTKTDALEVPLATVFTYPADRRFAARVVAAHLQPAGAPRRALPNVGALARIDVPVEALERDRSLVVLRERLESARLAAVAAKRDPPQTIALLNSNDLSSLKPFLSVRTQDEFRSAVLWCGLVILVSFHLVSLLWRLRGMTGDRVLLSLALLLVGIGFALMLSRPDPIRDTLLLTRYTQGIVIGVLLFGAVSMINVERAAFRDWSYVPLVGALILSVLLLVFGSGPGSSSAKVNLGPIQPIEAIRFLLVLFLAGYFARRWELLRQAGAPRLHHVLPVLAGVAAALMLFFVQKDLGPALLLSLMFLAMFAVARGGAWLAGAGCAGLAAGFAIGFFLNISATLAARLQMWQSPWDNAVRGGDQVAQALWALSAGALTGTGAGFGHSRFVPEGHTDMVLAAVGEEFGLLGLVIVGAAFLLVAWRGFTIAKRASTDHQFFLALGMTLSLTIPVLVMGAGILGLLPLTGVVTPFLSYGGSAMAANFAALGFLAAIRRKGSESTDLTPFQAPVRWLARTAAACAAGMLLFAASVQTLRADEYLVRPQLSVQADGGRRFQYNPRVLDALRSIPRGTIYDRRGLPIASSDAGVLQKAAGAYEQIGRKLGDVCAPAPNGAAQLTHRCYPAGPALQHVLGDANTRDSWTAANTSYVERDAEDLLRGFDDRAATVSTTGRDGQPSLAVRRDYTSLIPLVRHRYEPDHADVKALRARPRDVRITIDARFQLAVASIVERAARQSGSGKGAAVILDADTGELLASVSYPFGNQDDVVLDRARYGLYPPGSTFKIITAAAALREDAGLIDRTLTCQRLPNNRVGVSLPGHGPIHDDDRDRSAHGAIAMHEAIVKSCNAYFAQLAVALGSDALAHTAAAAGITLNTSRSPERILANLPHAGYGQGEVLVTPQRLARVAAAIGTDGIIHESPIVTSGTAVHTTFVTPGAARTLAGYLRDAVVDGTGRLLKAHPARIAGKTGTAEVDDAPSHAWFVGFAPQGPAKRRIAFAVILENAGYGGVAAANAAGQIATAAMSMGLLK